MKNEIIDKIISIPLSDWNGWEVEFNEVKIVICPAHTNFSPFITIDGIEFYGDKITDLKFRLEEYQTKQRSKTEKKKTEEIYDKLCV